MGETSSTDMKFALFALFAAVCLASYASAKSAEASHILVASEKEAAGWKALHLPIRQVWRLAWLVWTWPNGPRIRQGHLGWRAQKDPRTSEDSVWIPPHLDQVSHRLIWSIIAVSGQYFMPIYICSVYVKLR